MGKPGDLSSKKVKNTYTGIVQHDGGTSRLYDGTGSRVDSIDVTRITASKASINHIKDLAHLQINEHLSVSGSTVLGENCTQDTVTIVGNTWLTGSLTVSGSCEGSFRSIGQAKFIYLDNPVLEDQKPAKVTRGNGYGQFNVPRFGGENAALDVYGNVVITGSLIVQDTIWAQEFHSEVVSQSIMYTSGSTKFGGDSDDVMTITGSVFQSGSAAYFLNGMGIGTTGSIKPGTYAEPGQDAPVEFTHLLRIDDPGHDGLQHKNNKLIYGSFGSSGAAHVSASDVVRFRDREQGDDVFVISSISQSVFFSTNDKYNVGIGVPSGSTAKIDENLVVSSSTNARVKIESATGATSASLYLESGQGVWEIAAASGSTGINNQLSESLVFRTRNSRDIKNTFGANTTFTEALRLNNRGRAGFNIPSANNYDYPQQVQVSGSLNIIQGRTVDITAGTFHDSDGINGIYFNNQKMLYVSGSGINTNQFFGFDAGNSGTATTAIANIGIGRRALKVLTTGDYNSILGFDGGQAITTGTGNVILGAQAGFAFTDNDYNVAVGFQAMHTSDGGDKNIAIGYRAMKTGDVYGADNIAIGSNALDDLTSGTDNIVLGAGAGLQVTNNANNVVIGHDAFAASINDGDKNVAIGTGAMKTGDVSGDGNIAVGELTLEDLTTGTDNIAIGSGAGLQVTDNVDNIAIGHDAFAASVNDGDKNIAIGSGAMKTGDVSGANNIAIGELSLDDITTGTNNVAIGSSAGLNLTEAANTIAIGHDAMGAGVTTGTNNIAIGELALKSVIGATYNIAIGKEALRDTTNTAARNIAIGEQAAFAGIVTGADNIIMGTNAAQVATSLAENIIIGHKAVETGVMTGDHNTIVGPRAAENITSGADNVIIGTNAGSKTLTINTNNILIGSRPSASSGIDNAYAIGNRALVTQANSMVLGGQTGERFSIGMGGITAPNATLEVSGTVNITGSFTTSGSAHTIKGDLFVGEEVATTAWTMAHYGDTDTKWVVDDDEMIFTVGNEQMLKMTEDGSQDIVTIADGGDIDFRVSAGATNALFVQGSTARVGIGTAEPGEALEVIGDISASLEIHATNYRVAEGHRAVDMAGGIIVFGYENTTPIQIGKSANPTQIPGNVTASGNVSASGAIFTETIHTSQGASTNNTLNINPNYLGAAFSSNTHTLQVYGGVRAGINSNTAHDLEGILSTTNYVSASGFKASGNITASGDIQATNITASGNLGIAGNASLGGDVSIADALTVQGVTTFNSNVISGNAVTDTHTITGHVTASSNISASGNIIGNEIQTHTIDTAPGASAIHINSGVYQNSYLTVANGSTFRAHGDVELGNTIHDKIEIDGHVTASGNISASGYIRGTSFVGQNISERIPNEGINILSNVTASGDISASGNLQGLALKFTATNTSADSTHYVSFKSTGNSLSNHTNGFQFNPAIDRMVVGSANANGPNVILQGSNGAITASGNYSGSINSKIQVGNSIKASQYISTTNAVTAVNSAQSDGVAIPATSIVFIDGADNTKAAVLPSAGAALVGLTLTIHNTAGSALKVFPASGETINPLSQNAVASVPANTAMVVTIQAEATWTGYFTTVIA